MKKIATDYENNSEDFWNEIHRLSETNPLAKMLVNTNEFFATDDEAEKIKTWLSQVEGWDDPKAAEFAPNPILITNLDHDVFAAIGDRELTSLEVDSDCELSVAIAAEDRIRVYIENEEVDNTPDSDRLQKIIEKITGRELCCDPFGWHATGDSDQCYTGFRFEPIVFEGQEASSVS